MTIFTCTVAFGNHAKGMKNISLKFNPDLNTARNETINLTTKPMASVASPNPGEKKGRHFNISLLCL